MVSLTQIRWITGGILLIAPRGDSTLWRNTRKAMRTSWDGSPMKCFGRLVHTDDRRWSWADPQPNAQICGLDHALDSSLERIHHHLRKCGGRNHQTETAAGQRHYYRWQCEPGPIADGTDLIDEYRFLVQPSSWEEEGGFSRTERLRRS